MHAVAKDSAGCHWKRIIFELKIRLFGRWLLFKLILWPSNRCSVAGYTSAEAYTTCTVATVRNAAGLPTVSIVAAHQEVDNVSEADTVALLVTSSGVMTDQQHRSASILEGFAGVF